MSRPSLDMIRNCLEGIIPSFLATCDSDGTPNISEISQVQYVDPEHVALSYQFFNKTRRNVLATRTASVIVLDPDTNGQFRLALDYVETRTSGPIFEAMRAKLAGVASHAGMSGVFRLLGSDIYRVREIEVIPSALLTPPCRENLLAAARATAAPLAACTELGDLFDRLLGGLDAHFGIRHAMMLILDAESGRLFTVASRGYPSSGVGSEIGLGEGLIGVVAQEGIAIRIGHMATEYSYGLAVRDSARLMGEIGVETTEIPYPGLDAPMSQIALPLCWAGRTRGVLFAESLSPNAFGYDEEDALSLVLAQVSALVRLLQLEEAPAAESAPVDPAPVGGRVLRVRRFAADNTIFLDQDYLIKGVAGGIFWKLVNEFVKGRAEFTNRELRLDPALRLPEHAENLEARLVLLQRRLEERSDTVRICKCGRGRFRLAVSATLELVDVDAAGRDDARRPAQMT
jgi:adenylate cyclase